MASPQVENGHIDIANEIGEHLARFRISGEEYQILWVIWRKTYGWHKKEDCISLSQFFLATGMKKPSIVRAIKKLEDKNIISKKANDVAYSYRFNKDFESWRPLAKKLIVSKSANKSLAKVLPTKENYTKENTTSSSKISFNPETGKFENLDGNVERWRLTYAGVDILSELQKAECWIMANPGRAKKNWERFIVNWLCKAHEKALANGKHIQERQRYY